MVKKYWEADIKGDIIIASTLKELATKLKIKPSMIEGVYYRSRLEDKIKIRKVIEDVPKIEMTKVQPNALGFYEVRFN
jgi:ribosome-binding protein aMBF1 (putative translation factor)